MADVLVIGAGVGGLSAAIACAARGHSVLLLEAGESLGGKLGSVDREGAVLDTGPSVLTLPFVFDELLALAGEPKLAVTRPDPWFRYSFPGGSEVTLGHGLQGAIDGVRDGLGEDAASELQRFLERARKAWEVAGPRFVFGEAPSLRALASARPWELTAIQPFTRLWDWIRRDVRDERLRAILARYATYAGSDARKAPAVLGTIAWVELGLGGFGVAGGMHALAQRLEQAARKLGVAVRTGVRIASLEVAADRVRAALEADGTRHVADAVICNGDAVETLARLLPASHRRSVDGEPSYSGRCAIFRTAPLADEKAAAVQGSSAARAAHEVLFPARYLDELEDLAQGRDPRDPAVYLCAQGRAHGAAGFPGSPDEALFAMVNAPARGDQAGPEGWEDRLRERLVAAGKLAPDARLVWSRGVRGLSSRFGGQGALYGLASHSWATAFRRPPNRVASVRGLYLASGSAHPGAGLPLVACSGRRAAEAACADLEARRARTTSTSTSASPSTSTSTSASASTSPSPSPSASTSTSTSASTSVRRAAGASGALLALLLALPAHAAKGPAEALLDRAELVPGAAAEALRIVEQDPSPEGKLSAAKAAFLTADGVAKGPFKLKLLARALERARAAVDAAPRSGGAHFWLGVALAAHAHEKGLLALLLSAGDVRRELEAAAQLDPAYEDGAPLSALCALYHRAPGAPLAFGDEAVSRLNCHRALAVSARGWEAHEVLAEQDRARGDRRAALAHLSAILDGPLDPRLPRTHARYRAEARKLREELR